MIVGADFMEMVVEVLRPPVDYVEPPPGKEGRDWPVRSQEPAPEGVVEVPPGAYFIYPTPKWDASQAAQNAAEEGAAGATDSVKGLNLALMPARGGRKPRKKTVMWEVIRALTPEDIPLLNTTLPASRASLVQIRHTHHQLARLLAEGRSNTDASRLTGYSPTYVSILKDDPSFQELVAHYAMQEEMHHVDVLERMKLLGLSTLDTLQERLEDDPASFSNRELMEQAELMLVKPMVATRGGILPGVAAGPASNGVSINVNFIGQSAPKPQPEDILKHPATIDVKAERID